MKLKLYLCFLLVFSIIRGFSQESSDADIIRLRLDNMQAVNVNTTKLKLKDNLNCKALDHDAGLIIYHKKDLLSWENYHFLIIDLLGENLSSNIFKLAFYPYFPEEDSIAIKPEITVRIGFLPLQKTRIVFPLKYLDAQNIFLPRYPGQLKGTLSGNPMQAKNIGKVSILIDHFTEGIPAPEIRFFEISLHKKLIEEELSFKPIVDEYGQWTAKSWKNKIKNESDFHWSQFVNTEKIKELKLPPERSAFGGYEAIAKEATGFFYTLFEDGRWWFIDPEGHPFLSHGVNCINYIASGPVLNKNMFHWLPESRTSGSNSSISFYTLNLERLLGSNWKQIWEEQTIEQIWKFGLNSIGNWSNQELIQKANIPYAYPLRGFPSTEIKLFRDYPDVFDPRFKENSKQFASQLIAKRNDPYMIGYFLGNEPHWAFGNHNIALEMFRNTKISHSKSAFIHWIKDQYRGDIQSLNMNWNTSYSDFSDISTQVYPRHDSLSPVQIEDFETFTDILVREFFSTICAETKKADPNHLNLGIRFAYISSDYCYTAGEYFDVFSLNGYSFPYAPEETGEIAELLNKPVLIGEFHFGATDRGLPATGIRGVKTQKDRGKAYRQYVEEAFSRPEIIGVHYFQWLDQPIAGRFDGENYNIGLFDVCNQAYWELIDQIAKTGQNMYRIALSSKKAYSKNVKKTPDIYY